MAEDRRRKIIEEYFELHGLPDKAEERLRLKEEYSGVLTEIPVSRCPLTGEVVSTAIDTFGLEGLWWDYYDPVRPIADLPETQIAFTGALKLAELVEPTPFLVKPGPEVPFLVPRLIRDSDVTAVISQLTVGRHTGFVIVYFSHRPSRTLARFNEWGTDRYWVFDDQGGWWDYVIEENESLDFDLARWIEAGRLKWIAPGDQKMQPQSTVAGCPFLSLEGRRSFLHIQEGQVWEPDAVNR